MGVFVVCVDCGACASTRRRRKMFSDAQLISYGALGHLILNRPNKPGHTSRWWRPH
jgi:hypothetical protein